MKVINTAGEILQAGGGGAGSINLSAGTTSNNMTAVTFGNAGGVSFGLNGSVVTAAAPAGAPSPINFSAGTTSSDIGSVVFSNSNGISFGLNGSTMTATVQTNYLTTAMASNRGSDFVAATAVFAGTNASGTIASDGISVSVGNYITTAMASNRASDFVAATAAFAGTSASGTIGSAGISVSIGPYITTGMLSNAVTLSNIRVSGGTTSNLLSAITFANSNGISFGLDAGTMTATVKTDYLTTAMASNRGSDFVAATAAFAGTNASGTIASDGISISVAPPTTGSVNFSGGTTSSNLTHLKFVNSNGISFGLETGSVLTATVKTDYLTTAMASNRGSDFVAATAAFAGTSASGTIGSAGISVSIGPYITTAMLSNAVTLSNINLSAGTTSNNLSAFVFSNSNNVSFGLNGSTVTATITVPAQTNQTVGLYASSNTYLTSSSTVDARSLTFRGDKSITIGVSAGEVLFSVGAYITTAMLSNAATISNINVSAGTTSNNLSALTFSNGSGVSFGLNGSVITASVAAGAADGVNIIAAGTQTANTTGSVVFSNSNNVTFGMSNSSVVTASVTVASTQASIVVSAGTTSTTASQYVFSNSNNVSFGINGATVTGTVTVASTQGSFNLSAGTTSNLSASFIFSDSNRVSFGLNAGTITAKHALNFSAGTTSQNISDQVIFSNSNGVSFGLNGSTVTGSVATSLTNVNLSAGTTSNNLSAFVFSNSNNVSFGLNGSTITATITVPAQTNQTIGLYMSSNTTSSISSGTVDARSMTFRGVGVASVGYSGGEVIISVPAGAPSPVNFSAGTTSGNLGSVVFSNSNGVSFGLNGSTITATVVGGGGIGGGVSTGGNTAGSTGTVTTGNIVFVGVSPMSLSQSTGAAGSNATISILGPATSSLVGSSGLSISTNGSTITVYDARNVGYYEPYGRMSNTANLAIAAKSWYIAPFALPVNISGGRVNFYVSMTSTAGILRHYTANLASNTTGTKRQEYTYSLQAALWSQGTGTNSTRLESFWSNSFSLGISHLAVASVTGGANSVSANVSFSLSYIADVGSNGAYTLSQFASGATSNGTNTSVGSGWADTGTAGISIRNVLSDACIIPVGINTTITAGEYWMGVQFNDTTASSLTNAVGMASALVMSQVGFLGISRLTIDQSYKHWGSTTTANSQLALNPYGRYTASSAVPPPFIIISADLASTASGWVPYFNFQARGLTK